MKDLQILVETRVVKEVNDTLAAVHDVPETMTDSVNTIPPIQQNSVKNGYDENKGYGESYENKRATNYSIITNNKWNNAYNMQLTKHDTNDDVDTLHLHFNGRVAYMH